MDETITKKQFLNAYNNAPDIVRAVFNADLTTKIIVDIQSRFKLHIDSAGILAKEVGYLLLGLTDPSKFVSRLKSNNFPDQTTNEIVTEINQKIFVPLREEMRKGPEATPQSTAQTVAQVPKPAAVQPPRPVSQVPLPPRPAITSSVGGPPQQPQKHFQLQNKIPPRLAVAPGVGGPRPDLRNVLSSITKEVPKPIAGEKLLEDHEEPHIEFNRLSIQPRTVPPNLPGALPPRPVVSDKVQGISSPIIQPPVPALLKPSTLPITSVPPVPVKPYSSDPYREPVDEK